MHVINENVPANWGEMLIREKTVPSKRDPGFIKVFFRFWFFNGIL